MIAMQRTTLPIGAMVSAVIVLVASFMPWGTFNSIPVVTGLEPEGLLGLGPIESSVTAWNSTLTLAGVIIPNWITVMAAGAFVAFGVLRSLDIWCAPRIVDISFALFGGLQAVMMMYLLGCNGRIGIGSVLTAFAFLALIIIALRPLYRRLLSGAAENLHPPLSPKSTRS
jgi:hypothetical protein